MTKDIAVLLMVFTFNIVTPKSNRWNRNRFEKRPYSNKCNSGLIVAKRKR